MTLVRAQFDQFPPETVLSEGVSRALGRLASLERAAAALVAGEAARFYAVPACEVFGCATGPARTPRFEARRARDAAIYVLHISLGYPKAHAAQIYGQSFKDAGAKAVRRVDDAREGDPALDQFLDQLDARLRDGGET